jgi:hypothetical protein
MATVNAKQLLSNIYGLMMEINLHRSDEEVWEELNANSDPQIDRHLRTIKQMQTKLKAASNKQRFIQVIEQLQLLKEKGIGELRKLIQPNEEAKLIPLFSKFEELTEQDQAAIMEDQELLELLEILKTRIDDNPEQ